MAQLGLYNFWWAVAVYIQDGKITLEDFRFPLSHAMILLGMVFWTICLKVKMKEENHGHP